MAYGRKGELAEADLASAQAALARGDMKTARELAARAKMRFATGAPGWVKADDIATYRPKQSASDNRFGSDLRPMISTSDRSPPRCSPSRSPLGCRRQRRRVFTPDQRGEMRRSSATICSNPQLLQEVIAV